MLTGGRINVPKQTPFGMVKSMTGEGRGLERNRTVQKIPVILPPSLLRICAISATNPLFQVAPPMKFLFGSMMY